MVPPLGRQAIVGVVVVLCIAVLVAVRTRDGTGKGQTQAAAPLVVERGAAGDGRRRMLVVDVAGAVRRPGVYELAEGSRVTDAIRRAGGPRAGAQLAGLNRAAPLVDGQQVLVPVRDGAAASGAAGSPGATGGSGGLVSINSADVAQLDTLPGIGPVTAQHIVDDRQQNGPFASVDDLDRVPGIGAATIEQLRSAVTL